MCVSRCVAGEETHLPLYGLDLPDIQHILRSVRVSLCPCETSANQFGFESCDDDLGVDAEVLQLNVAAWSSYYVFRITTLCFPPSFGRESCSVRHISIPEMTDSNAVTATLNDLPRELLDAVIDFVPQNVHLKQCALVGKRWVRRCQERLFERFTLSSQATERWTKPVAENQPLLFSYVKKLTLLGVYPPDWVDANFERHMSCFGGGGDHSGPDDARLCRVSSLRLMDSSVDVDGEVISRVLGPLRSSVRTVIMSSVCIPPAMDVRPFLCMFSKLQNVHVPGPQFSSLVPHGESRLANDITLPPLDGELRLFFLYHGLEGVISSLSKLPLRFQSITVSPPGGRCDLEIDNILVACGETLKTFRVRRMKLGMPILPVRVRTI